MQSKNQTQLILSKNLEKNSTISRTTKGGFKQANFGKIKLYNPQLNSSIDLPVQTALDEDVYFDKLEAIIKRDFFPTGQEVHEAPKMRLDEYLRRYTSEDNISFQELQEKDRQKFMDRIKWMFDESGKHKKINQLAMEFGHQNERKYLVSGAEEASKVDTFNTRSVPAIAFAESDPRSSLFFGNPGIDKNLISTSEKQIEKANTRFDPVFLEKQNGDFKVPQPKNSFKIQGVKAREAIGLYMTDQAFQKKREVKYSEKSEYSLPRCDQSVRSFRTSVSHKSTMSMRQQITTLSTHGQKLLKNAIKKKKIEF